MLPNAHEAEQPLSPSLQTVLVYLHLCMNARACVESVDINYSCVSRCQAGGGGQTSPLTEAIPSTLTCSHTGNMSDMQPSQA